YIYSIFNNQPRPYISTLFPYTTLFRSVPNLVNTVKGAADFEKDTLERVVQARSRVGQVNVDSSVIDDPEKFKQFEQAQGELSGRSEEHTSELQSRENLVCRLLLEKKNK